MPLAPLPDQVLQIVNSRTAIFTKKGAKYDTTARALSGRHAEFLQGVRGPCEARNNER
jgi:hypothetical protein